MIFFEIFIFGSFFVLDAVAFNMSTGLGRHPWWAFLPGGGFLALMVFGAEKDIQK